VASNKRTPDTASRPKPVPWWPESHATVLARVRGAQWPSRLFDLETLAGEIVGDELYARVHRPEGAGLNATRWLEALADQAAMALYEDVAADGRDWPRLWAFLCGLGSEVISLKLEFLATLLSDRALRPSPGFPPPEYHPTGDALVAQDAYGSRFLVVAPFAEIDTARQNETASSPSPDHWYAWDLDWCGYMGLVMTAGPRGSAAEALAQWRGAVGPAATAADLSPCPAGLALKLLRPALASGTFWEAGLGGEPRELLHERYRLNLRARALAGQPMDDVQALSWDMAQSDAAEAESAEPEKTAADEVKEAFLAWHAERAEDSSLPEGQAAEAAGLLAEEWRSFLSADEMAYGCSPHRIEMTGVGLREGLEPDLANLALRLLPDWTQWCLTRRPVDPEAAARSLAAARVQAAIVVDDHYIVGSEEEQDPFTRRE
jgi:hypothetical protein